MDLESRRMIDFIHGNLQRAGTCGPDGMVHAGTNQKNKIASARFGGLSFSNFAEGRLGSNAGG